MKEGSTPPVQYRLYYTAHAGSDQVSAVLATISTPGQAQVLPGSSLFQGRALHQDMNIESVSVFQSWSLYDTVGQLPIVLPVGERELLFYSCLCAVQLLCNWCATVQAAIVRLIKIGGFPSSPLCSTCRLLGDNWIIMDTQIPPLGLHLHLKDIVTYEIMWLIVWR